MDVDNSPDKPPLGSFFNSDNKVQVSGLYIIVRHTDNSTCRATMAELRIVLEKGELFPFHKKCNKGVVWRLSEYRE
jgi:hypothetical protein